MASKLKVHEFPFYASHSEQNLFFCVRDFHMLENVLATLKRHCVTVKNVFKIA